MLKEPHALISAAKDEVACPISSGFLLWGFFCQTVDICFGGHAVEENERRIPSFRNHPVCSFGGVEKLRESDKAVGVLRG